MAIYGCVYTYKGIKYCYLFTEAALVCTSGYIEQDTPCVLGMWKKNWTSFILNVKIKEQNEGSESGFYTIEH